MKSTSRTSASDFTAGISPDPIRFQKNLKVTIQALGWKSGVGYERLDPTSRRWRIGIKIDNRLFE